MQWLTTTAASVFAGSGADEAAGCFGEANGVFGGELEANLGVGHGGAGYGREGDGAALILDLEGQVFGGEDSGGGGDVEDAGKFAGREAVFGVVVGYPGLQDGGFGGAHGAAAVDESFFHEADFGDVELGLDGIGVGEDDVKPEVGVGVEEGFEFDDGYGREGATEGLKSEVRGGEVTNDE